MTNKKLLRTAVAVSLSCSAMSVSAVLPSKASFQMGPQTGFCDFDLGTYPDGCLVAAVPDGNFFAMDNDGSGVWENGERVGIEAGTDGGILLGVDQSALGGIDATWNFFGNPGNHTQAATLSVATATGNTATINMSGWTVMWGAPQAPIDMGQGADAIVTCAIDCAEGDTFTIEYDAVVPDGGFAGVAYQFHIYGTIVDQNLAPVATADPVVSSVAPDGTVNINLAANVSDPDGDGVDNTSFIITYTGSRSPAPMIADDGTGLITYTDNAGTDTTTADTFTYTVADTLGKVSDVFTVEVSVVAGNLPPIASPFSVGTNKDTAVTADVVANTIDNDGTVDATTVEVANVVNGSVTNIDPVTGVVTFTPGAGLTGLASFDYRVMDDSAAFSNFATVTVNINAPPIAVDDNPAPIDRNTVANIDVTANDTDSDGTVDPATVTITIPATNGATAIDPVTGVVTYTPTIGYLGADSFDYTIDDNDGLTSETAATVSINVVNALPVAVNDTASINVGIETNVAIDVAANDTDADGTIDAPTVTVVTNPADGATSVDALGMVIYTPAGGFVGSDTFTYTVNDNDGGTSNIATVIVTVSDSGSAVLPVDATLTILPATITGETVNITPADGEGSWFNMEVNPGVLTHVSIQGFNHLQLSTTQLGSEAAPNIDNPWPFFGNQGVHQTLSDAAVLSDDGQGNVTTDLSGWSVSWNKIPSIPMTSGAHTDGFVDGVGIMTCANDCAVGDSYKLEYSATVPAGDPSGFGNVKYFLHLEGIVSAGAPTLGGGDVNAPYDVTGIVAADENGIVLPVDPGSTAISVGNTTGINLTPAEIGIKDPKLNEKDGEQCIGGCADFIVSDVTTGSVALVVKLNDAIPSGAIYRKLINGVWVDFDESQGDQIGSAPSVNDACQGPEGIFENGLRANYDCLFMRLVDNGPNDADKTIGTIVDPSGILLAGSPNTPAGSSDGCSISSRKVDLTERADWLIVAGFIVWLGLIGYRRNKAVN